MPKEITDYKYWLGVMSFLLTAGAVVFYGGKNAQKLDALIETNAKLERQLPVMAEKINDLQREVDLIKAEFKHLPNATKITADNLPLWRYKE